MSDARRVLPIHSLAEAHLYVMVTPCSACGTGPQAADAARVRHDREHQTLTVPITCQACGRGHDVVLDARLVDPGDVWPIEVAAVAESDSTMDVPTINPTDEPSRVIDVPGWLTLYSMLTNQAQAITGKGGSTASRAAARRLAIQAGACLTEALKFYESDNDLPPEEALFGEASRRQFRDRPAAFARNHLIELRAKLPAQHGTR